MTTTTPLLGLTKPDDAKFIEIDQINDNMDKIEEGTKGKMTLPYSINRKTDGFGTQFTNNQELNLVAWNSDPTAFLDLGRSTGVLNIAYNAGEFTVPCAGIYRVEAGIRWETLGTAADTTGTRRMSLYMKRGATTLELVRDARTASGMGPNGQNYISKMVRCAANDILYFTAVQSSGVVLALDASSNGRYIFASIVCSIRTD
jgi:hypothetical protein